jgi:MoxR-like ATPase
MIPSPPDFVDINHHVRLLQNLLQDYANGERSFLLLGNQGVGKNVVIDRLCQLARFEREYIQLHRDSTISQLTLTPSLEDGKIIWKDSPLVRAVTEGRALVIDEADKAPVEVISVLKGLVEDGELALADGRRISRHTNGPGNHCNTSRLFALRSCQSTGVPFLGKRFLP